MELSGIYFRSTYQKIVGYIFSKNIDIFLVMKTLDNDITTQNIDKGLIIHLDRAHNIHLKNAVGL